MDENNDILSLTADIAAAYVSNNSVPASEVPTVIQTIYRALGTLGKADLQPAAEARKPAVPVRKSIRTRQIRNASAFSFFAPFVLIAVSVPISSSG